MKKQSGKKLVEILAADPNGKPNAPPLGDSTLPSDTPEAARLISPP